MSVIVVLAALVLFRRQLTEAALAGLASRLEQERIYLSYDEQEFTFTGGLRLRGLTLYETSARDRPVLKMSNLTIATPLRAIWREGQAIFEVKTNDATLVVFEGEDRRQRRSTFNRSVNSSAASSSCWVTRRPILQANSNSTQKIRTPPSWFSRRRFAEFPARVRGSKQMAS